MATKQYSERNHLPPTTSPAVVEGKLLPPTAVVVEFVFNEMSLQTRKVEKIA